MAATKTKLRSPLKTHGGKSYLARRIVPLMPAHATYVEPFCGGCSVLLNKPRSEVEIAGDLDPGLIDFWGDLRNPWIFADMYGIVRGLDYSVAAFQLACGILDGDSYSAGMRAAMYLARNRMSRGGMGKTFAWSDRLRGGQPGDVNAWETALDLLPAVHERISDVFFWNAPATQTIERWDSEETLFYLDPPYMHDTRTAKQVYNREMTDRDHAGLLDLVRQVKGRVMCSGYHSPLYDIHLADWRRIEWDLPNHSAQTKTKQRRTEVLWLNF